VGDTAVNSGVKAEKTTKKDSYFIDYAPQARYAPPFVNNSIDFGRSTP